MTTIDSITPEELRKDLREKIDLGHGLLQKLDNNGLKNVQGIAKLEKKVKQEVKFLEKFEDEITFLKLKKEHISCSNLVHLESFISQIFLVENPTAVMQPFNLWSKGETNWVIFKLKNVPADGSVIKKVVVDIICDKGKTWVKVVARNPRALDLNSQGGNQFGQKSILDQVRFIQSISNSQ